MAGRQAGRAGQGRAGRQADMKNLLLKVAAIGTQVRCSYHLNCSVGPKSHKHTSFVLTNLDVLTWGRLSTSRVLSKKHRIFVTGRQAGIYILLLKLIYHETLDSLSNHLNCSVVPKSPPHTFFVLTYSGRFDSGTSLNKFLSMG